VGQVVSFQRNMEVTIAGHKQKGYIKSLPQGN